MASIGESSLPPPQRYRGRVGIMLLLFVLALGPLAWIVQLLISYSVATRACYPDGSPLLDRAVTGFWWALLIVNLAGIVLALVAAAASYRNYRVARIGSSREVGELRARVEGRAQFLAGWGGMAGLGFFAGGILDTIALLVVPPCLG